jgi:hypothetical protein
LFFRVFLLLKLLQSMKFTAKKLVLTKIILQLENLQLTTAVKNLGFLQLFIKDMIDTKKSSSII